MSGGEQREERVVDLMKALEEAVAAARLERAAKRAEDAEGVAPEGCSQTPEYP